MTNLANDHGSGQRLKDQETSSSKSFTHALVDSSREHVTQLDGRALMTQDAAFDNDPIARDVHLTRSPAPRSRQCHCGERCDEYQEQPVFESVHVAIPRGTLNDERNSCQGDQRWAQDTARDGGNGDDANFIFSPKITPTHTF